MWSLWAQGIHRHTHHPVKITNLSCLFGSVKTQRTSIFLNIWNGHVLAVRGCFEVEDWNHYPFDPVFVRTVIPRQQWKRWAATFMLPGWTNGKWSRSTEVCWLRSYDQELTCCYRSEWHFILFWPNEVSPLTGAGLVETAIYCIDNYFELALSARKISQVHSCHGN